MLKQSQTKDINRKVQKEEIHLEILLSLYLHRSQLLPDLRLPVWPQGWHQKAMQPFSQQFNMYFLPLSAGIYQGKKTFPSNNAGFSPGLGFNTFVTGGLVHLREGCTQVSVSGRNSGTVTHGASELEQYLQSDKHITN